MKMLIQVVLVALVMGGLSAVGSFYWNHKNAPPPPAATAVVDKDATSKDDAAAASKVASSVDIADSTDSTDSNSNPPESKTETLSFGPPVAVRPPFDPDGDEAGDLIKKLRVRAASASRQERRVIDREEAMKLIVDDFRTEQSNSAKIRKQLLEETNQTLRTVDIERRATEAERLAIEEDQNETRRLADEEIQKLRREKDEAVQSVEQALKAAREEQQDLQKQLDATRKPAAVPDRSGSPEETVNLKKMVGVVDSMPAEDTAKILQELVEKGRIEAVVAVLNAMKARQSAKVLSAITESKPALAADLIDRLKRLKKEAESAAAPAK